MESASSRRRASRGSARATALLLLLMMMAALLFARPPAAAAAAVAAVAVAPPQPPTQTPRQPSCGAIVTYGASAGSSVSPTDLPLFVAQFTVQLSGGSGGGGANGTTPTPTTPTNNTLSSWALGWRFGAGEHITGQRDVFGDPGVYDVRLADAPLQQQGVAVFSRTPLGRGGAEATLSIVGRKGGGSSAPSSTRPLQVAAPSAVFFNNQWCWPLAASLPRAAPLSPPERLAVPGPPPAEQERAPDKQRLVVEYLPVQYADLKHATEGAPIATPFTQFYVRVSLATDAATAAAATTTTTAPAPPSSTTANIVPVDQIVLHYWFDGPVVWGSVSAAAEAAAEKLNDDEEERRALDEAAAATRAEAASSLFRVSCSDATVGCASLRWSVTPGEPRTRGARFLLSLWFDPAEALALVSPEAVAAAASRQPRPRRQRQQQVVPAVEGIVAIEPRRFFAALDASRDYSYRATPLATATAPPGRRALLQAPPAAATPGALVRRQRRPNPRIVALISGKHAWGQAPIAGPPIAFVPPTPPPSSQGAGDSSPPPPLPTGAYCEVGGGGGGGSSGGDNGGGDNSNGGAPSSSSITCGVSMVYCCYSPAPLAADVPDDWPVRLLGGVAAAGATGREAPAKDVSAALRRFEGEGGEGGGAASPPPALAPAEQEEAAAAPAPAAATAARGGSGSLSEPATIAFATVLPALAVAGAAVAVATVARARRRRRKRRRRWWLQASSSAADGGGQQGGGGGNSNGVLATSALLAAVRGRLTPDEALALHRTPLLPRHLTNHGGAWLGDPPRRSGGGGGEGGGAADDNDTDDDDDHEEGWRSPYLPPSPSKPLLHKYQTVSAAVMMQLPWFSSSSSSSAASAAAAAPSPPSPSSRASHSGSGGHHHHHPHPHQAAVGLIETTLAPSWFEELEAEERLARRMARRDGPAVGGAAAASSAQLPAAAAAGQGDGGGAGGRRHQQLTWMRRGVRTWTGRVHRDAFPDPLLPEDVAALLRASSAGAAAAAAAAAPTPQRRSTTVPALPPPSFAPPPLLEGPTAQAALAAEQGVVPFPWAGRRGTTTIGRPPQPPTAPPPPAAAQAGSPFSAILGPSPTTPPPPPTPSQTLPRGLSGLRDLPAAPHVDARGRLAWPPGCAPLELQVDLSEEVTLGRVLGRGGHGAVYAGVWRGRQVAVKVLSGVDFPRRVPAGGGWVAMLPSSSSSSSSSWSSSSPVRQRQQPQPPPPPPTAAATASWDALVREVALAACFRHCPRIVPIVGACLRPPPAPPSSSSGPAAPPPPSTAPARPAIIMELMRESLAARLYSRTRRRPDLLEALRLARDVAAGLSSLHALRVVHGDLKPQNVLLDARGRASLADFGLSRALGGEDDVKAGGGGGAAGQRQQEDGGGGGGGGATIGGGGGGATTGSLRPAGTPPYMAPECFTHGQGRIDEKVDVYAFACVTNEMLARKPPFAHLLQQQQRPGDGAAAALPPPPPFAFHHHHHHHHTHHHTHHTHHQATPRPNNNNQNQNQNLNQNNPLQAMYRVVVAVAVRRERPDIPQHAPAPLAALLRRCWLEDPAARPTAREAVAALDAMLAAEVSRRAALRAPLRRQLSWTGPGQQAPVAGGGHQERRRAATTTIGGGGNGGPSRLLPLVGVDEYAHLALFGGQVECEVGGVVALPPGGAEEEGEQQQQQRRAAPSPAPLSPQPLPSGDVVGAIFALLGGGR
jgi:serine/threonine protein kinase